MDILRSTLVLLCIGIAAALPLAPFADRARLTHDLLSDYDKHLAPGLVDGTVHCNHSIPGATVISFEDNVLDMSLWSLMEWIDERLAWNSSEYGNTKQLKIPVDSLWVPDVVVQESIIPNNPGFTNQGLNAIVESSGKVTYIPPVDLKTKCVFDESDLYTNNRVNCNMKFQSWTYSCTELDIQPSVLSTGSSLSRLMTTSDWDIETINATHNSFMYSCCPEAYCDITYTFTLRRVA